MWSIADVLYNLEWWEVLGAWNSIVQRLNKHHDENERLSKNNNKQGNVKTEPLNYYKKKAVVTEAARKARERILAQEG